MKIAAVIYDMGEAYAVDALLASLATRLKDDGHRLAGAVQHNTLAPQSPCSEMVIEDLATGQRNNVSLSLGDAGGGCRLNAALLEDVVGIVAAGLDGPVELVVINRFGKQEIAGQGFRAMIEATVARDIPLLIALNSVYRDAWQDFAAGHGTLLAPTEDAIETWCRSVLAEPATPSASAAL